MGITPIHRMDITPIDRSHPLDPLDLADAQEAWRGWVCSHDSPAIKLANVTVGVGRLGRASTVRFRANRTLSRHRRMTECDRGRVKTRLHDCVGSDTRAGGRT